MGRLMGAASLSSLVAFAFFADAFAGTSHNYTHRTVVRHNVSKLRAPLPGSIGHASTNSSFDFQQPAMHIFVPGKGMLGQPCNLPTSACPNEMRDGG
jgi:hypothetical protein